MTDALWDIPLEHNEAVLWAGRPASDTGLWDIPLYDKGLFLTALAGGVALIAAVYFLAGEVALFILDIFPVLIILPVFICAAICLWVLWGRKAGLARQSYAITTRRVAIHTRGLWGARTRTFPILENYPYEIQGQGQARRLLVASTLNGRTDLTTGISRVALANLSDPEEALAAIRAAQRTLS